MIHYSPWIGRQLPNRGWRMCSILHKNTALLSPYLWNEHKMNALITIMIQELCWRRCTLYFNVLRFRVLSIHRVDLLRLSSIAANCQQLLWNCTASSNDHYDFFLFNCNEKKKQKKTKKLTPFSSAVPVSARTKLLWKCTGTAPRPLTADPLTNNWIIFQNYSPLIKKKS